MCHAQECVWSQCSPNKLPCDSRAVWSTLLTPVCSYRMLHVCLWVMERTYCRRTVYSRLDTSLQGNAETGLVGLDRIALCSVDLLLFFSQSCTVSVVVLLFVMLADAGICIEQFWFRIVFITSHCTIKEDNYCVFAPPFDFMICLLLHCISYIGHVVEFDMIRDNNYFFCCSLLFLGHYLYMY